MLCDQQLSGHRQLLVNSDNSDIASRNERRMTDWALPVNYRCFCQYTHQLGQCIVWKSACVLKTAEQGSTLIKFGCLQCPRCALTLYTSRQCSFTALLQVSLQLGPLVMYNGIDGNMRHMCFCLQYEKSRFLDTTKELHRYWVYLCEDHHVPLNTISVSSLLSLKWGAYNFDAHLFYYNKNTPLC